MEGFQLRQGQTGLTPSVLSPTHNTLLHGHFRFDSTGKARARGRALLLAVALVKRRRPGHEVPICSRSLFLAPGRRGRAPSPQQRHPGWTQAGQGPHELAQQGGERQSRLAQTHHLGRASRSVGTSSPVGLTSDDAVWGLTRACCPWHSLFGTQQCHTGRRAVSWRRRDVKAAWPLHRHGNNRAAQTRTPTRPAASSCRCLG